MFLENVKKKKKLRIPVFDPGNKLILIWEIIWMLLTILMFWWTPMIVCFSVNIS